MSIHGPDQASLNYYTCVTCLTAQGHLTSLDFRLYIITCWVAAYHLLIDSTVKINDPMSLCPFGLFSELPIPAWITWQIILFCSSLSMIYFPTLPEGGCCSSTGNPENLWCNWLLTTKCCDQCLCWHGWSNAQ